MNRKWYALALLLLLTAVLCLAGHFMQVSIGEMQDSLEVAYRFAENGEYPKARQAFEATAQKAVSYSPFWILLVRRNLVDQFNQTLATIPSYATQENQSDLAVETARAQTQALQIQQSFFSWF